jgi:hypothetical protein
MESAIRFHFVLGQSGMKTGVRFRNRLFGQSGSSERRTVTYGKE